MSHTNSTPNYGLPQFITTDKPAWLTDINTAFNAIDTGIDNAADAASSAQSDASDALTAAGTAGTTASAADSKASGAIASIGVAFSDTNTYEVGDLVIYNNLLYRCKLDVNVPGAWTGSTNWERTEITTLMPKDLGDLDDVTITSPSQGQTLVRGVNGWDNVLVQANWNESSNTSPEYIKNKPNIPTVESGTMTATSNVNIARYSLKKYGTLKFISAAIYVDVNHVAGAKLAQLSITPTSMVDLCAVSKSGQHGVAWYVDTDGYLYTNDAMQTGQTYYMNGWFI